MRMVEREGAASAAPASARQRGWLAAGGLTGAVLASACCIGPLALVLLGVSGAWIGNLVALEPFRPFFAAVAILFIGLGFHRVYWRQPQACAEGALCARPASAVITKSALWLATALVIVALTIDWWAPYLY